MSDLRGYSQMVTACILYGLIGIFIELIGDIPLGSVIFYRLFFGLASLIDGGFLKKEESGMRLCSHSLSVWHTACHRASWRNCGVPGQKHYPDG